MAVLPSGSCTAHAIRLRPGDSLMSSLKETAAVILGQIPPSACSSVFVLTAVGSLESATLRLANFDSSSRKNTDDNDDDIQQTPMRQKKRSSSTAAGGGGEQIKTAHGNEIRMWSERFEIVSLVGTFSRGGKCHVHISLSDASGNTIGGHLIDGVVFTTVELVLGTAHGVEFAREHDEKTGFSELVTRQLPSVNAEMKWKHGVQTALLVLGGVFMGMALQLRGGVLSRR